jgi:hypothetical protein
MSHECKIKRTFILKFSCDAESPPNSFHFLIDSNTGKGVKINYCPFCGINLHEELLEKIKESEHEQRET